MFQISTMLGRSGFAPVSGVFNTRIGTATQLDSLPITGWDLLIAKARSTTTGNWSWRESIDFTKTLNSTANTANAAFTNYSTLFGSGSEDSVIYRLKKKAGFLDIVSFTGNATDRYISHSLGSAPGIVIVKSYSSNGNWPIWSKGISDTLGNDRYVLLNSMSQSQSNSSVWGNEAPSSSTFKVGTNSLTNANGVTFRALLLGHDSSINGSCHSGYYTGNGESGPLVDLGWKPQFVMIKNIGGSDSWHIFDNVRSPNDPRTLSLFPDSNSSESNFYELTFLKNGFRPSLNAQNLNRNNNKYLFWAVRADE